MPLTDQSSIYLLYHRYAVWENPRKAISQHLFIYILIYSRDGGTNKINGWANTALEVLKKKMFLHLDTYVLPCLPLKKCGGV